MRIEKKKKGKGCKKVLVLALLVFGLLGCGGSGEDTSSSSVITNCGNRILKAKIIFDETLDGLIKRSIILKDGVQVTCNIGDDELGSDKACQKCKDNFNECSQNPEDNGLTDDSKCKEIYYECAEINGCEISSETE
jgi:hypothetical protein